MPYIVECVECGKEFRVPDMMSLVPKHPREGETDKFGNFGYIPCPGSGLRGKPVEPSID